MYIYTYVYMCVHVCLTSCGDPAGETYSSLDELRNQVPELFKPNQERSSRIPVCIEFKAILLLLFCSKNTHTHTVSNETQL